MPTITALVSPSRGRGKTKVYIDGRFLIDLPTAVVARLGLQTGQDVDEFRLTEIVSAAGGGLLPDNSPTERLRAAVDLGLRYLEPRQRSRREIALRLARAGYDEQTIEMAIDKLEKMGLVNDSEFASRWVEAKTRPNAGRTAGRRRIAVELQRKGIDREIVANAVSAVGDDDEIELARAALRSKLKPMPDDPEAQNAEKRRLTGFLARRGFGWDTISVVLRELGEED